ncbi:hypothetical protein [Actinoplanes sp. NPDC049265]|uniref:hypothetical protein n=1 Tax=Actinoplanes sp. NPDC049265 TaxID=3363902 RepID=UPI003716EE17
MVPFDDDLINGPFDGLADPLDRLRRCAANIDAVLGYRRLFDRYTSEGIALPFVLNLTGSTVLRDHTRKVLVGTVDAALRAGCDAVAVHVNLSSVHESTMLAGLAKIGEDCDRLGMPLAAIMYPRRETDGADDNYLSLKRRDITSYARLVQHCVRVGVELGADLVKTQYTGDPDSFGTVISTAMGVPVIVAGGPKVSTEQALRNAHGAIAAGAAGVCFGRNTYNRTDTAAFVQQLAKVVHSGVNPDSLIDGRSATIDA